MAFSNTVKSQFCLVHQNIQCIRNKINELELLLHTNLKTTDFLCITEHWLMNNEITSFKLQNFTLSNIYCRSLTKNGGAAIFIRNGIQAKPRNHTQFLNIEKNFEHVVSEVCL